MTLYKNYQNEVVFLSQEQKTARQTAIVEKEKEASDLKKKYFGSEGELYKKRQSLLAPIQDEIYNAVKDICDQKGYQLVIDRASGGNIIYASPKIDISEEVLTKLGYANWQIGIQYHGYNVFAGNLEKKSIRLAPINIINGINKKQ